MVIGRRGLIALAAGGAIGWPLAARPQQPAMPVIGSLHSGAPIAHLMAAFRNALQQTGFVEGRNVAIEYRWAEGNYDLLEKFASDLLGRRVMVIVSWGAPSTAAVKATNKAIPVVFNIGLDPVKAGFVQSFSRPGGNMTGFYLFVGRLVPKRLGILRDLIATVAVLGILLNSENPNFDTQLQEVREAARADGQQIMIRHATKAPDLDDAFAAFVRASAGAVLVGADPFFQNRQNQIVALAARHAIPAIYELREFADAGGLISYGPSLADGYRQVGVYTGRILKGEKPSDLPIVQPTRFELVINLKTAKALGLTVPLSLLAQADEVIE